jgi:hypothetical protein
LDGEKKDEEEGRRKEERKKKEGTYLHRTKHRYADVFPRSVSIKRDRYFFVFYSITKFTSTTFLVSTMSDHYPIDTKLTDKIDKKKCNTKRTDDFLLELNNGHSNAWKAHEAIESLGKFPSSPLDAKNFSRLFYFIFFYLSQVSTPKNCLYSPLASPEGSSG